MKIKGITATSIFLIALNFLTSYNYYLLRTLKDSILVASSGAGAEVIPFAKFWLLLPASFLVAGLFTALLRRYPIHKVFQWATISYCLYFFFFAVAIHPFSDSLRADTLADSLIPYIPTGWAGLISLIRFWTLGITYVVAETWSTLICYLLFWGLANEVSKIEEAKRTYPWIILAGNIAAIIAGGSSAFLCSESMPFLIDDQWQRALLLHVLVISLAGAGMYALLSWNQKKTVDQKTCSLSNEHLAGSIPLFFKSRYLLALGLLVFAFTWIINMTEVLWKDRVFHAFPDPNDFQQHMSLVISATGLLSALLTLFVCTPLLRRFGWRTTKLVCVGLLFFSAVPFLFFDLGYIVPAGFGALLGSPAMMAAGLGSIHVIVSRSTKYTLGATTKELAFIPLSSEEKLKGKSVIDGIVSRIGKIGGSATYQFLLLFLPTIHACTPWVALVVISLSLLMVLTTFVVARNFEKMTGEKASSALALS